MQRMYVWAAVFTISSSASWAQNAKVEEMAAKAFSAAKSGNYSQAVELYLAAYEVSRNSSILYNLASLFDRFTHEPQSAIEYYQRFVAAKDAPVDLVRKAMVRIAELKTREAQVAVSQKPESPAEALSPALASPAEKPSVSMAEKTVPNPEPAVQMTLPVPVSDSRLPGLQMAGLVTGGIGLLTAGVGLVFGARASALYADSNQYCSARSCREPAGIRLTQQTKESATAATVLVSVGGAAVATGLGLLIFGGRQDQAPLSVVPVFFESQRGVALSGVW